MNNFRNCFFDMVAGQFIKKRSHPNYYVVITLAFGFRQSAQLNAGSDILDNC